MPRSPSLHRRDVTPSKRHGSVFRAFEQIYEAVAWRERPFVRNNETLLVICLMFAGDLTRGPGEDLAPRCKLRRRCCLTHERAHRRVLHVRGPCVMSDRRRTYRKCWGGIIVWRWRRSRGRNPAGDVYQLQAATTDIRHLLFCGRWRILFDFWTVLGVWHVRLQSHEAFETFNWEYYQQREGIYRLEH